MLVNEDSEADSDWQFWKNILMCAIFDDSWRLPYGLFKHRTNSISRDCNMGYSPNVRSNLVAQTLSE
jgi:hypothetical protein